MSSAPLPKEASLSLVTLTGTRPEAFKLCCKWMMRQVKCTTAKPHWVIVDDGSPSVDQNLLSTLEAKYTVTYLEQPRKWTPGKNTQRRNLIAGLNAVHNNYTAIIEDDDWYAPNYLSRMMKQIYYMHCDATGEANTLYYHLPTRTHKRMLNMASVSLCQMVFKSEFIPILIEQANSGAIYFDIPFWMAMLARGKKLMTIANTDLCIGIKGMPGRGNITAPKPLEQDYIHDDNLYFFRKLLKQDSKDYEQFMGAPQSQQRALVQNANIPV